MNLSTHRSWLGAALLGATFMLASTCQAQVAKKPEQNPLDHAAYNAEWKGTLQLRGPESLSTPNDRAESGDLTLRIVIDGKKARIFIEDNGKTIEALPGRLDFFPAGPIAVINGWTADSADGKYPSWIESISILLSLQSHDVMLAEWRRVVNNVRVDTTTSGERAWSIAFGGTLQRQTPHGGGTNQ